MKVKWIRIVSPLILGSILGWVISDLNLDRVEAIAFDERIEVLPKLKSSNSIVLVALKDLDQTDGTTIRGDYTLLDYRRSLEVVLAAQPMAVISLIQPQKLALARGYAELFNPWASNQKALYFTTPEIGSKDQSGLPAPFENLQAVPFVVARDIENYAKDQVSRRGLVSFQGQPYLHFQLAQKINPDIRLDQVRGAFESYGVQQIWMRWPDSESYPILSLRDLTSDRAAQLKNKIILIYDENAEDFSDFAQTPLNKGVDRVLAAHYHAALIENLIQNSGFHRPNEMVHKILMILVSVLTAWLAMSLSPARGLFAVVLLTAATVTSNLILFGAFNVWMSLAEFLLSLFVCYYFVIPYRLIQENKRRWEIEQKHDLLSEVEQLKTNFISMMSHDLKTPLARIRGMIELIQREPQILSLKQAEALDIIKSSSQDLLSFIETILNYATLESRGVELQLRSTDLNQVVETVVRRHDFLAKAKHIQVELEMEPLFAISLDAQLIEQALSNIVENALKYSPESSQIMIHTKEEGNFVWIKIKDQGPGMNADELQNIFLKFFRAKNAKNCSIKGSGLGLYLARYFIELHKGSVQAESVPGAGTTFTVKLPVS